MQGGANIIACKGVEKVVDVITCVLWGQSLQVRLNVLHTWLDISSHVVASRHTATALGNDTGWLRSTLISMPEQICLACIILLNEERDRCDVAVGDVLLV